MMTGCIASTMTALGQYSAAVVATAANATPKITGTATHSKAAAGPWWKRNPRSIPVPAMTSVVKSRRTISAPSRDSSPAARWMGSDHNRARNPSRRSALMPTIPVVDPDIVATSATSGTLRYSAFSPVMAVIESPKTTLRVSRNATGSDHGVDQRHGGARRPDEQPPGEHHGLRQQCAQRRL